MAKSNGSKRKLQKRKNENSLINNVLDISHKKECTWISSNEIDEPGAYHTGWSKSEREKQISYVNIYIWNLERWYWWTYLQGSNGDTDIVVVQSSSRAWLFATLWTAAHQASLSFTSSQSLFKLMVFELVMLIYIDADIENRIVDPVGEGEGETNWECSIETYTLPYVTLDSQ